jgi:ABC-type multidrug transport system fused ATPase/permease subunit
VIGNQKALAISGKHEKLLAQKGFYAELYNSQFDKSAVVSE